MVLTSLPLSRGPSPSTSPTEASGAPPRQPQSAGGPLRPSPLPIPAAHVQGTMPVGLPPAVSSVPKKTPPNCRPKGEGDAAGGERHLYLNLFPLLAGLHEMVTPEAWHKWGKTRSRREHARARRSRGVRHGGKGWRRRVGEPRHHHCRHRIRRCNRTPGAAQKMHWPRRTNGRQPGSPPGAHAPA